MRSKCVYWLALASAAFAATGASADDMGGDEVEIDPHAHHQHEAPLADDRSDDAHVHPSVDEPIGVMGAHMHEKGSFMFSYRYARMRMDGNRDGTEQGARSTKS